MQIVNIVRFEGSVGFKLADPVAGFHLQGQQVIRAPLYGLLKALQAFLNSRKDRSSGGDRSFQPARACCQGKSPSAILNAKNTDAGRIFPRAPTILRIASVLLNYRWGPSRGQPLRCRSVYNETPSVSRIMPCT